MSFDFHSRRTGGVPTMGTSSPKRKRRCRSTSSVHPKPKKYCSNRCISHRYSQLRDWSNMGIDILEHIHKRLPLTDTLVNRAVCSRWRSVSKSHILPSSLNSPPPRSLSPLLWYYEHPYSEYWLLDIAQDGGATLYLPPNLETKRLLRRSSTICVGSSSFSHGGYLLFHDDTKNANKLSFLHPFLLSVFSVHIPPINNIVKALVLADPIITDTTSTSSCHGFVVLDGDESKLKFAKCGAIKYAELEGQDHKGRNEDAEMIFINDCIYTIRGSAPDHYMEAWDCSDIRASNDDDDRRPKKVLGFQPTFTSFDDAPTRRSTVHLVESQGELLLVAIRRPFFGSPILHKFPGKPTCSVYRMDFMEKKWLSVDSLGDRVLFVMEFQTLSLSSVEFPQYERNSIYFRHHLQNDDSRRPLWTMPPIPKSHLVVFNMKDNSLQEIKTTVTGIC